MNIATWSSVGRKCSKEQATVDSVDIFGTKVHSSWQSSLAAKICRSGSGRAGNASCFSLVATCCSSACRVEAATDKGPNQYLVPWECLPELFNPPFCPMRGFVG